MKLKNRLLFSIDFIQNNKRKLLIELILLLISFCLFYLGFMMLEERRKYRHQVEMTCRGELDNLGQIRIHSRLYNVDYSEIIDNIEEIEGYCEVDDRKWGVYRCIFSGIYGDDKYLNMSMDELNENVIYAMNPGGVKVFSIELSDGKEWTKEEIVSKEKEGSPWSGVYLGNDYQDIAVGTKFIYHFDDYDYTFEVLGHLKKDSKILLDSETYYDKDEVKTEIYKNMNDGVIVIDRECNGTSFLFRVKEGYKLEEVCQNITQKYKKNNIFAEPVIDILDSNEKSVKNYYGQYLELFYLISIIASCSILCLELISTVNRKKEFGILLTNGFTTKELRGVIIWEMILKFILCIMLGFLICSLLLNKFIYDLSGFDRDFIIMMNKIFVFNVYPKAVKAVGLIMLIGNIFPLQYILRKKPVELVR